MYVSPITVNSKQYKAIFDIGASTTFMSEAFAKRQCEIDCRFFTDTWWYNGLRTIGYLGQHADR